MRSYLLIALILAAKPCLGQTPVEIRKQIEEIFWMTEQYPPFNYIDDSDGQLKGITVDILMEMFAKVGVTLGREDLKVLPWARSINDLIHRPNTALFSTTYTVERLQLFKFVGPIVPTQVSIIAKKSRGLQVRSKEDMEKLRIGVIRDDIGDELVRSMGVGDSAIQQRNSAYNMVHMLDQDRLDAIAYAEDIAQHQFVLAKIDPAAYETVFVLQKSHMGYAFHKDTDPRVLEPLRKALDELRANGTVERIRLRYLATRDSTTVHVDE